MLHFNLDSYWTQIHRCFYMVELVKVIWLHTIRKFTKLLSMHFLNFLGRSQYIQPFKLKEHIIYFLYIFFYYLIRAHICDFAQFFLLTCCISFRIWGRNHDKKLNLLYSHDIWRLYRTIKQLVYVLLVDFDTFHHFLTNLDTNYRENKITLHRI